MAKIKTTPSIDVTANDVKWNLHYAVKDAKGNVVCEDSSWDCICEWADSHLDDYPNNKVYAVWDCTKKEDRRGLNGDVLLSHWVCAESKVDFKKEEDLFFKLVLLRLRVELTKDHEEFFCNCWH